jgi:hypothetical protein
LADFDLQRIQDKKIEEAAVRLRYLPENGKKKGISPEMRGWTDEAGSKADRLVQATTTAHRRPFIS